MSALNGKNGFRDNLPAISLIVFALICWELISHYSAIPEYILPSPLMIAKALTANFSLLLIHTGYTFGAVLPGLALAIIVAPFLAILMDRFLFLKRAIYPLLVISQAVPIFAIAPLILIWFGVGLLPKILIVALVCFFPLTINLVEGFNQVDPEAVELMQTMQANRLLIIRSVQLPFTLPYFFSGLKIAATYSILGAIIGEWLAAKAGLGIYMLRAMHSFRTTDLFAAIILVVTLSLALFKLVELTGRLAMPWQRDEAEYIER
jgi:ABC-type nitrate/sulfonate/bicarbonate transport system permease component